MGSPALLSICFLQLGEDGARAMAPLVGAGLESPPPRRPPPPHAGIIILATGLSWNSVQMVASNCYA